MDVNEDPGDPGVGARALVGVLGLVLDRYPALRTHQ